MNSEDLDRRTDWRSDTRVDGEFRGDEWGTRAFIWDWHTYRLKGPRRRECRGNGKGDEWRGMMGCSDLSTKHFLLSSAFSASFHLWYPRPLQPVFHATFCENHRRQFFNNTFRFDAFRNFENREWWKNWNLGVKSFRDDISDSMIQPCTGIDRI